MQARAEVQEEDAQRASLQHAASQDVLRGSQQTLKRGGGLELPGATKVSSSPASKSKVVKTNKKPGGASSTRHKEAGAKRRAEELEQEPLPSKQQKTTPKPRPRVPPGAAPAERSLPARPVGTLPGARKKIPDKLADPEPIGELPEEVTSEGEETPSTSGEAGSSDPDSD